MTPKRRIKLIIFSLLFLVIELFSYIILSIKDNTNVIKRTPIYYKSKTLHPYLGYVENNKNYSSLLTPFKNNTYTIGIFGGSVAKQICNYAVQNPQFNLKASKKIKIYCFAHGGWRQPQQSLAFSLYGKYLDHAIFIEGHNEMNSKRLRDHQEYPLVRLSSIFFQKNTDETYITYLSLLASEKLYRWSTLAPVTILNSEQLIRRIAQKISLFQLDRIKKNSDPPTSMISMGEKLHIWKESLEIVDALATKKDINVDIILQPELITKKELTSTELLFQKDLSYHLKRINAEKEMKNSTFSKIKISSYIDFFSEQRSAAFIDDIHLNTKALKKIWINLLLTKIKRSNN